MISFFVGLIEIEFRRTNVCALQLNKNKKTQNTQHKMAPQCWSLEFWIIPPADRSIMICTVCVYHYLWGMKWLNAAAPQRREREEEGDEGGDDDDDDQPLVPKPPVAVDAASPIRVTLAEFNLALRSPVILDELKKRSQVLASSNTSAMRRRQHLAQASRDHQIANGNAQYLKWSVACTAMRRRRRNGRRRRRRRQQGWRRPSARPPSS